MAAVSPIWILLVVLIGCVAVARMLRPHRDGERRHGWGMVLLLILLAIVLVHELSHSRMRVEMGQQQAEAMQRKAEMIERQMEAAQRRVAAAGKQADAAANQAVAQTQHSMQALWDQINEPRIQLDANDQDTPKTTGEQKKVEVKADKPADAANAATSSDAGSMESLSHSLARLEQLARQVSSVAHDVSDVAGLVGRGMIAQQNATDSEPRPESQNAAAAAKPADPAPTAKFVPSSDADNHVAAAQAPAASTGNSTAGAESPAPATSRPGWVDLPPQRIAGVWRQVVATDEYATPEECDQVANIYLLLATYNHIQQMADHAVVDEPLPPLTFRGQKVLLPDNRVIVSNGRPVDPRLRALADMDIGINFVRHEIVPEGDRGRFLETVERSFGPMNKLYTMMEFSPSVDRELRVRWDDFRRESRLMGVGLTAGSLLGLMTLVFGLLKVDTWTRGYYTKRLFLGVPVAIIGLGALLAKIAAFQASSLP